MNVDKILNYCYLVDNNIIIHNSIIIEKNDIKIIIIFDDNIYIIFRGSCNTKNITDKNKMKNVKFINNSKVHSGFLEDYNSVKNYLLLKLYSINFSKIIACGHSFGGTLAMLFAFEFKTSCITFGSPRIGNKIFCNNFNKNVPKSIRIIAENDPIPFINLNNYKHTNKSYCITDNKDIYYDKKMKNILSCISEKANYDIKKHSLLYYKTYFDYNKFLEIFTKKSNFKF